MHVQSTCTTPSYQATTMLLHSTLSTTLSTSEASRASIFPLHKPPRDPGCESRSRSYAEFMSHVADHMMRACMIDLGDEMQIQTATLGLSNDGYSCLIWAKCMPQIPPIPPTYHEHSWTCAILHATLQDHANGCPEAIRWFDIMHGLTSSRTSRCLAPHRLPAFSSQICTKQTRHESDRAG